jgi:hypothetical protein
MSKKQIVPNTVAACEAALSAARAELEAAQQAILSADPGEVISRRDAALIAEASVRKAERDLATAKATEADRDRASRLEQLAALSVDPNELRATLTDHAKRVVECEALLATAKAAAKAACDQADDRREQAIKLADSLGVALWGSLARAAYLRSAPQAGTAQPELGQAGVYHAALAEAELAAGRISENVAARRICWALGTDFPKGEKPVSIANVRAPHADGALAELRAAGVTDKDLIRMAWDGSLQRFYYARRDAADAHRASKHNAHRHTDVAGRLLQDLANLSADHDNAKSAPARAMLDRLGDDPRANLQWTDVDAVCRMYPGGSLAKSLSASERATFASPQPSEPVRWDAKSWLARNVTEETSEAAE